VLLDKSVVEAFDVDDNAGFAFRATRLGITKTDAQTSLQDMVGMYETSKKLTRYADIGLSIVAEVAKEGISKAPATRTGAMGALIAATAKAAMSVAIDKAKDDIVATLTSNNERQLGARVQKYFETHGGKFDALYDANDMEVVRRELGLDAVYDATRVLPDIDPQGRTEILIPVVKRLEEAIAHRTLDQLRRDAEQDAELERLAEDNVRIWGALKKHHTELDARLSEVEGVVSTIASDLAETAKRTLNNEKDIDSLALIVSGTLPPRERKEMIEAGLVEVPADQKVAILADLDRQIKTQVRIAAISRTLNEGAALVSVLRDLKVSDKVVGPASRVIQAGAAVFSAYLNFQTGNYFAAAASITGMFGGGSEGPDPAVMAALQAIQEKLDEMDKKLDKILENQQKMLKQLDAISNAMREGFERLTSDVLWNRELIIDARMVQLKLLEDLDSVDGRIVADFRINRFPNYLEIKALHQSWNLANEARWALFDIFSLGNLEAVNPHFFAVSHAGKDHPGTTAILKSYLSLMSVVERLTQKYGIDIERFLGSALAPTDRVYHLDRKLVEIEDPAGAAGRLVTPFAAPLRSLLKDLISVGFLGRTIEALLNTHLIYMARPIGAGAEARVPDPGELLQREPTRVGLEWIRGALKILDIAIAQQTLLSGDLVLPLIRRLFNGTLAEPAADDPDKALKTSVLELLADPELVELRKNAGLVFVRARLAEVREQPDLHTVYKRYAEALREPSLQRLELHNWLSTNGPNLHRDDLPFWNLVAEESGQYLLVGDKVKVDKVKIPLPSSERVADASVVQCYHRPSLPYLLELREYLIEHRNTYTFAADAMARPGGKDLYNAVVCIRR
jgi:hypothetical protein